MLDENECTELAWKIFEDLRRDGVIIGNAAVYTIKRTIGDYLKERDYASINKALDEALNSGDSVYRP